MIEVHQFLKKTLSAKRYQHCLNVAQLSSMLAKHHGWDPALAYQAGFLHDCAKEWSPQKLLAYAKKNKLKIPDMKFIQKNNPNLFHAYVGADVAKKKGWLNDRLALAAIRSHTLADLKMSIPQMILYVADFASKDRTYSSARKVRALATKNLRSAYRKALAKKIRWNLKASKPVHPFTIEVWNALNSK